MSADAAPAPTDAPLAFTGERYVPGVRGEIWLEHWHRYHYACRFARGQRVVDVACGEGYGSALLAQHAASVIGVDASAEAIAHAQRAYATVPRLTYQRSSCTALPLADSSIDLVVSFETIEHIEEQEAFIDEVARVLAPGGVLLLSCPNKAEYTDRRGYRNEFHIREPYRAELASLIARRFPYACWLGHRLSFHSVIAPEGAPGAGEFFEAAETSPSTPATAMATPLYFIAIAGRTQAAVAQPAPVSVLGDRDHQLYADYFAVTRAYRTELARREALELEAQSREADHSACRSLLAAREAQLRKLSGLRGWLRRPLVRLGLLRD